MEEDSSDHFDWIVVTSFYQALHWIDAYLLTLQCKPLNHEQRRLFILRLRDLDPIAQDYWALKAASESARYKQKTFRNKRKQVQRLVDRSSSIIKHIKCLMQIP